MSSISQCRNIVLLMTSLLIGMSGCKNSNSNESHLTTVDTSLQVAPIVSDTMIAAPATVAEAKAEQTSAIEPTVSAPTKVQQAQDAKKPKESSNKAAANGVPIEPKTKISTNPKAEPSEEKQGDYVIEEKKEQIKSIPGTGYNPPKNTKPNHDSFNRLLAKYVSASGAVNYKAWKKDMPSLNDYIIAMAEIDVIALKGNEKMAYCLNVYNANTIKLVLDHYPVKSIQNIAAGKPWDERIVKSGSNYFSLNEWENGVIRKMGESRIHFALNCAAKSCPPLSNQAFTTDNVTAKMQSLTSKFINSEENSISEDKLVLSKIFDWYKADFGDSVIEYINKYVKAPSKTNAKITYKNYDWSLNE